MNMVGAIGMRTVYTWHEVCGFLGMELESVKWRVRCNQLVKRYSGQYPFAQTDVNEFITRLNAGKISVYRNRKLQASAKRAGGQSSARRLERRKCD